MSMRTPLSRTRGLGSAKEGTEHFWWQRVTAFVNMVLGIFVVWVFVGLVGADFETTRMTMASPLVAIPFLLFVMSASYHMKLGMQVIIEDYVQSDGRKTLLILLNIFYTILVALTCVFAILKISFGA